MWITRSAAARLVDLDDDPFLDRHGGLVATIQGSGEKGALEQGRRKGYFSLRFGFGEGLEYGAPHGVDTGGGAGSHWHRAVSSQQARDPGPDPGEREPSQEQGRRKGYFSCRFGGEGGGDYKPTLEAANSSWRQLLARYVDAPQSMQQVSLVAGAASSSANFETETTIMIACSSVSASKRSEATYGCLVSTISISEGPPLCLGVAGVRGAEVSGRTSGGGGTSGGTSEGTPGVPADVTSTGRRPPSQATAARLPSTARSMMVGRVFLVLTGACQFGHGVGGFTTNFIHSQNLHAGVRALLAASPCITAPAQ